MAPTNSGKITNYDLQKFSNIIQANVLTASKMFAFFDCTLTHFHNNPIIEFIDIRF